MMEAVKANGTAAASAMVPAAGSAKAPRTVIVKYNAGNVRSVLFALERLGVQAVVTDDSRTIAAADRVIFPGVGEASSAMAYLRERGLDKVLTELRQPVLGICLGMQLMCRSSEEGGTEGLGIFPVRVRRFAPPGVKGGATGQERAGAAHLEQALKIPQIGWNDIRNLRSPLFEGVDEGAFVYFVHGYYAETGDDTTATADYGGVYSAALGRDNFHAVQFHPERSGVVGRRILENFIFGACSDLSAEALNPDRRWA